MDIADNATLLERAQTLEANGVFLGGPIRKFEPVGRNQLSILLRTGLNLDSKVLDVGCGAGAFGEILKEPQEKIIDSVGVVPGTDGEKMSKSKGNTIPLFGTTEEIEKAVMGIVTDSDGDRPEPAVEQSR